MTSYSPPSPPAILSPWFQGLPQLSFAGFRAAMPIDEATRLATAGGGALTCKRTTDTRIRECNGRMPFKSLHVPFAVLVSTVRDSASVIVLTAHISEEDTRGWVSTLTQDFGVPNHLTPSPSAESWQWIRRGQMLRVNLHRVRDRMETSVTLTDGPLLDGLGPPATKKPD